MTPTLADLRSQAEQARAGLCRDREEVAGFLAYWESSLLPERSQVTAYRVRIAELDDRLADLDGALAQAEQHQPCERARGGARKPCPDFVFCAALIGRLARRYGGAA